MALGFAVTTAAFPGSALADSCPITAVLAVTDAQQGFAGKTGTIWRIFPGCSFSVTRFIGTMPTEPHLQGQPTPDQQRILSAVMAKTDIARLPARIGEAAQADARTVSPVMTAGARDLPLIQSAKPSDPRRRLIGLVHVMQHMLGN